MKQAQQRGGFCFQTVYSVHTPPAWVEELSAPLIRQRWRACICILICNDIFILSLSSTPQNTLRLAWTMGTAPEGDLREKTGWCSTNFSLLANSSDHFNFSSPTEKQPCFLFHLRLRGLVFCNQRNWAGAWSCFYSLFLQTQKDFWWSLTLRLCGFIWLVAWWHVWTPALRTCDVVAQSELLSPVKTAVT